MDPGYRPARTVADCRGTITAESIASRRSTTGCRRLAVKAGAARVDEVGARFVSLAAGVLLAVAVMRWSAAFVGRGHRMARARFRAGHLWFRFARDARPHGHAAFASALRDVVVRLSAAGGGRLTRHVDCPAACSGTGGTDQGAGCDRADRFGRPHLLAAGQAVSARSSGSRMAVADDCRGARYRRVLVRPGLYRGRTASWSACFSPRISATSCPRRWAGRARRRGRCGISRPGCSAARCRRACWLGHWRSRCGGATGMSGRASRCFFS